MGLSPANRFRFGMEEFARGLVVNGMARREEDDVRSKSENSGSPLERLHFLHFGAALTEESNTLGRARKQRTPFSGTVTTWLPS